MLNDHHMGDQIAKNERDYMHSINVDRDDDEIDIHQQRERHRQAEAHDRIMQMGGMGGDADRQGVVNMADYGGEYEDDSGCFEDDNESYELVQSRP